MARSICRLVALLCTTGYVQAWVTPSHPHASRVVVRGFWKDVDAVLDDFMNKRLGGGEIYYGARQSKFYGEEDRQKSQQEYGKYEGKGYSDKRRLEEKLGRSEGPKWVGDSLKEGSYWDGIGKDLRKAKRVISEDDV